MNIVKLQNIKSIHWRDSPKMAKEQDSETTFSPTNSSKDDLNVQQLPQKKLLNTSRGNQELRKADHSL